MSKALRKRTVLLVCGGKSPEHKISLISCHSVFQAIDRKRYKPIVAGIDWDGTWHFYGDHEFLENPDDPEKVALKSARAPLCFPMALPEGAALAFPDGKHKPVPFDLAFPVLHGANGEDGTIQGLFEMLAVPYVGCDVAASANCMDKERAKVIASDLLGIAVAPFYAYGPDEDVDADLIEKDLGFPLFVKPARTGSSIGVICVRKKEDLDAALTEAFRFDDKVLVEQAIQNAREIECAVLETAEGDVVVANPGEVIPAKGFYDYKAKYLDADGARLQVPAELSDDIRQAIRAAAAMVFDALGCSGMARVDFFYRPGKKGKKKNLQEEIILNEVNTIPGFTGISLYPKTMADAGLDYATLVTNLLETAVARYDRRKNLELGY